MFYLNNKKQTKSHRTVTAVEVERCILPEREEGC